MNRKRAGLVRPYRAALAKFLRKGPAAGGASALRLGRRALALGFETLDLALVFEAAFADLASHGGASSARRRLARAKTFFAESLTPIVQSHRAAAKSACRAVRLSRDLRRRTEQSNESSNQLKRSVIMRRAAEQALRTSKRHRAGLLGEARRLQVLLLSQTREILAAHEKDREKSSHRLHNDIAQTLLAIHLRLLKLKTMSQANTQVIEGEILQTQELVKRSVLTIRRVASEFRA